MLALAPIIAHESEGGYVWWDEALLFAIPIVVAVGLVMWLARRSRQKQPEDDQRP